MMPRMRKIKEAVLVIKKQDPESAITEHFVRRLCTTGKIPTVRSGKDYLLNMDTLEGFLMGKNGVQ